MTTKEKHEKHPPLAKPSIGKYHRSEWAIYGTTCEKIKNIFEDINNRLSSEYRLAYIDADHGTPSRITDYQIGIKHFSLEKAQDWNEYDDKFGTPPCDAVIVNGNHYPAARQIVVLDPDKKDSLKRRENQLTNITMVIRQSSDIQPYDFLVSKITSETLFFNWDDPDHIAEAIKIKISGDKPLLKTLILAGGKSKRMGKDKALISYHDRPQQLHLADMCRELGLDTYISKSTDYDADQIEGFPVIKDRLVNMGPFGAIISAMMYDPDAAWLVLACDLPFIDKSFVGQLIARRDSSHFATAAKSPNKQFPEPLVAIYEPGIYPRFLQFMSLGYSCPRKVLINSDIKTLILEDDIIIENINTPEEKTVALNSLKERS